jgi:hypothetical protein
LKGLITPSKKKFYMHIYIFVDYTTLHARTTVVR